MMDNLPRIEGIPSSMYENMGESALNMTERIVGYTKKENIKLLAMTIMKHSFAYF